VERAPHAETDSASRSFPHADGIVWVGVFGLWGVFSILTLFSPCSILHPVKAALPSWNLHRKQKALWSLGALLASVLSSIALPQDVDFSILLPDAERVYLLGTFNHGEMTDDSLMKNENGVWTKTISLEEGTVDYYFKVVGGENSGRDTFSDWKSLRLIREEDGIYHSRLIIPEDLTGYSARFQRARQTEAGIEIPLFYQAFPEQNAAYCPGGYGHHPLATTPPSGDWKFPAFTITEPLYCPIELGGSTFLAILDQTNEDEPFYDRIYFDRNGNRDLTDEEPIAVNSKRTFSEGSFYYTFSPVDIQVAAKGRVQPYRFTLTLNGSFSESDQPDERNLGNMILYAMPSCAYMGEFMLDGIGYRVALGDATGNALFGDTIELPEGADTPNQRLYPRGDSFLITRNNYFSGKNSLLFGNSLIVGDHLFDVHLDLPRGTLLLQPRESDVGTLELPNSMQSMNLISSKGKGLMMVDTGNKVPVPSGEWRLLTYSLLKKDAWGDQWVLSAAGSGENPAVAVPNNGSAHLDVGEPLQSLVKIADSARERAVAAGSLRMSFLLRGHRDEIITDLRRISGSRTQHETSVRQSNCPKEPAYRIIKPDGELITSGSFEYG